MKHWIAVVILVLSIIFCFGLEKSNLTNGFSPDRIVLYIVSCTFIFANVFFDYKKFWNFIYNKRYLIGIIIFSLIVIRGYHGSSIGIYDEVIEPGYQIASTDPILGSYKPIRSDEFLVDTPALFSQYYNNNEMVNNSLMARSITPILYPQLPTKSIYVLLKINYLGFLFLDLENAFSFYWYLPYFMLFFSLFELLMILTKKNKFLSLIGTLMIEFSSSLLWWNATSFLLYGSLATIFFYYLFKVKEKWKKIILAILLGWAGSCYIMIMYPAWQVPYGYLFLGLFIYILIKLKDNIKWQDFLYLLITILVIVIYLVPLFIREMDVVKAMTSTVYPGARNTIGGDGWQYFYLYFQNIFYPFIDVGNPCEFSQVMSLYPLPLLLGIYYLSKETGKKKNYYLLMLVIVGTLLSVWNYVPIGIIARLSLLYNSTTLRGQIVVGVICMLIIIEIMNSYSKKSITKKKLLWALVGATIYAIVGIYFDSLVTPNYMTSLMKLVSFLLFASLAFLLIINTHKGNFVFGIILGMLAVYNFATIQPINKGIEVMTEKPVAKEIRKIVKEDPEGIWATFYSPLQYPNYCLANGARVLNSPNYYPNMELWEKFDEEHKYSDIVNRYAHIYMTLTEDETNFELILPDYFQANINKDEICKLNIDYIVSPVDMTQYGLSNIEKIYGLENVLIYKVDCGN